jgi:hypothetical protein
MYAHVVFTVPHALAGLALQNKRVVYDLLFQASAATLLASGHSPARTGHREPQHISAPEPAFLRFNPHTDPPHPPQTPAASFKRLYRE